MKVYVYPTINGKWAVQNRTSKQDKAWMFLWRMYYYSVGWILGKVFDWWK